MYGSLLSASQTLTDTQHMKYLRPAFILILALATTACFGLDQLLGKSPSSPSDSSSTTVRSYLGTWNGPGITSYPTAQSCGNMQWKITSQTGSQISGDFQATCAGGTTLVGTVVASDGETTIQWAATGTATSATTSCPFSLSGNGTFQGTSNILATYAGTVCGALVSGSETIKR